MIKKIVAGIIIVAVILTGIGYFHCKSCIDDAYETGYYMALYFGCHEEPRIREIQETAYQYGWIAGHQASCNCPHYTCGDYEEGYREGYRDGESGDYQRY